MSDTDVPAVPDPDRRREPPDVPLYAGLELAEGGLVVYDAENHRAWIQSDAHVALTACV
jgi:hypothetical protein